MGSAILRTYINITDDGDSEFNYDTPTLSLCGTKDGLLRISRGAEAYWHAVENINDA